MKEDTLDLFLIKTTWLYEHSLIFHIAFLTCDICRLASNITVYGAGLLIDLINSKTSEGIGKK